MDPVTGLALGRLAVGAAALARPDLAARAMELDTAANTAQPLLSRLFGSREIALGALTLVARGRARRQLVLAGIGVDLADAVVGLLATSDGTVSRRTGAGLVTPAVSAVLVGAAGLRRVRG